MSHLMRQEVPRNWPIKRKGSTYVVKPNFNINKGIPVLIILRDLLKLAQTRKEAKKIIHLRQVLVNERKIKDEKNNVLLFDTINVIPLNKCYRLELSEKGKFYLKEINKTETEKKISKIINKKSLRGKKIQLNLSDGRNSLSEVKCNINDSVLINLKEGKIEKCLPLKEKAEVIVFAGKHSGKKGVINKLNLKDKTAEIKIEDREINILINQLMVVE
ncbi:MAG: S4 domain-containing protein [Candidatus Pacearchaeota archaeon]|nr:S4 domain-containing protein [Candidatus Pacearchaeota archaeon]